MLTDWKMANQDLCLSDLDQGKMNHSIIRPRIRFLVSNIDFSLPKLTGFLFVFLTKYHRQQMRRVQQVRKDVPGEYIFLEVQVTRVR